MTQSEGSVQGILVISVSNLPCLGITLDQNVNGSLVKSVPYNRNIYTKKLMKNFYPSAVSVVGSVSKISA